MYSEHQDVDLDEEPCIFPDCSHPLTISSMDGQMGNADHYELSEHGLPIAIKAPLQPFASPSDASIKVCPKCRGSLRNIARYGRIVRRGLLDEATKKFIAWSDMQLKLLLEDFALVQEMLEDSNTTRGPNEFTEVDFSQRQAKYFSAMCDAIANGSRFSQVKQIHHRLEVHLEQVGKDEQPYQRVANIMRFADHQRCDVEVQMTGYLKTLGVLLRCKLLILGKYLSRAPDRAAATARLKLDDFTDRCDELSDMAEWKKLPRPRAEGHILRARFCALIPEPEDGDGAKGPTHKEQGEQHLRLAERVIEKYPSTKPLQLELDIAWREIRGSFYSSVSKEERLAVYQAMAREFMGTGHWYTCEQGHPFTVGECGMPMQLAECPECGAPVGGQRHVSVEGVQRDNEMEQLARAVGNMGV